jgi:hypothetical protein
VSASTPHDEYAARLAARNEVEQALNRRHEQLANLRLLTVGLAVLTAWLVLVRHDGSAAWILVPLAAFLVLAIWHDRVLQARDRATRAVQHYQQGLARLEGRWPGSGETGDRFLQPDHPYAADLDLFGRGSLFELIATARIRAGQETLARWLLAPATPQEITARQGAVAELSSRTDLREDLAVLGGSPGAGVPIDRLVAWGAAPPLITARWPAILAAVLGTLTSLAALGWILDEVSPIPVAVLIAAEIVFSIAMRARVRAIIGAVDGPAHDLALLSEVLARVEREPVSSAKLTTLRALLTITGRPPSYRIRSLRRLVDLLNSRQNQLFAPIAAVMLWTPQVAFAIDRWRARSGPYLGQWLEALGEFEALCSLAGYMYEHPADPFPQLEDGAAGAVFDGEELAHPLLDPTRAVPNSVHLVDQQRLLIVSGSNMSGKSTLLRTVGVNAVLALAGAPVRARRLRLTPLAIGATLRVQDSLMAGQSRFFAEITRIRAIVGLTEGQLPVLFLLDELLSGTNSHDRQHGAEAIVRGLLDRGAIGLVTTHDLALSAIADRLQPRASNVHFADEFRAGELTFDYRMRPGVVTTSNALALMRAVGLEV